MIRVVSWFPLKVEVVTEQRSRNTSYQNAEAKK